MENPAVGKILGMAMAYAVSSLGLLLAYYNYRKRIVKAEQIFTPKAKAIISVVVGITLIAVIGGSASLSPGESTLKEIIPGIIVPVTIFAFSFWLTWALYRHFSRKLNE